METSGQIKAVFQLNSNRLKQIGIALLAVLAIVAVVALGQRGSDNAVTVSKTKQPAQGQTAAKPGQQLDKQKRHAKLETIKPVTQLRKASISNRLGPPTKRFSSR